MDKSSNSGPDDGNKVWENSSNMDDNDQPGSSTATFHKLKKRFKRRSYRKNTFGEREEEDNSDDSEMDDNAERGNSTLAIRKLIKLTKSEDEEDAGGLSVRGSRAESKADSSGTDSEINNDEGCEKKLKRRIVRFRPESTFSTVNETMRRQIGQSKHFQRRFYGSLRTVERLKFLHALNEHEGCVNTVEFNENGDLLVSGSDDLAVCVWNWATGRNNSYKSGHRNNIFQASWLPRDHSTMMVTCASDGQVRLLDLVQGTTRKLASHHGACNKFAIHPDTPDVAISVGDDGKVLSVDVRDDEATKLVTMKEGTFAVQLYTIHSNPRNSHEFCVGGHSESIKIFDRRKVSAPFSKLCPKKLIGNDRVYITAVTYNHNGTEILASYNDDDIYLFDTLIPHPAGDYAHKYEGHRNSRTIKGVNYFGPNGEFIVSGSDCGNIFFWEKNTEIIVHCMRGDFKGVVNCVKSHPSIPVLASSGLDQDVKIWAPSADGPLPLTELVECVTSNLCDRAEGRPQCQNDFDGNMFCILLENFCQNRSLFNFIPDRRSGGTFDDDDFDDSD